MRAAASARCRIRRGLISQAIEARGTSSSASSFHNTACVSAGAAAPPSSRRPLQLSKGTPPAGGGHRPLAPPSTLPRSAIVSEWKLERVHKNPQSCHLASFSSDAKAPPTPDASSPSSSSEDSDVNVDADAETATANAERATQLELLELEGLTTTEQYNEAIVGYAEIGDPAKADELLLTMEKTAKESPATTAMPDVDSYTAVMDSWLAYQTDLEENERGTERRGDILHAAERIDAILQRMERASTSLGGESSVTPPTSHHYDAAVTAWSRCVSQGPVFSVRGLPQRAQAVLERMESLSLDRSSGVRPTVETYNQVIGAWGNSHEHAFAPLAQALYERMQNGPTGHLEIRPNDRTIRSMLNCWAKSDLKNAAFHATGHLMKLQELAEGGADDMDPTIDDYLVVLNCWSRSDDRNAARRAQTVLKQMERLFLKRISDVRPTVACYRYVLVAMSNSKLAGLGPKADELMARMEDRLLTADSTCFGATIKVWSNSACHKDTKNARTDAEKADKVLQQMKDMYHRSSQVVVKPTTSNYNDVIRAYSMCRRFDYAAWRACELLEEMLDAGDADAIPDTDSYVLAINTLSKSHLSDKVAKSIQLLEQINQRYQDTTTGRSGDGTKALAAVPTTDCYHAVLNVCASVKGENDDKTIAFRTAIKAVKMLKDSAECRANPETYRLLIETSDKLLTEGSEQAKALETIFKNCCRDGLLDDKVLKQFKKAASSDLYDRTVIQNAKTSTDSNGMILPEEWTRNIGHKIRTADGRKPQPLSPDIGFVVTPKMVDYKMRRLRSKKNQRLLRGGRS